jgi:hypothetical protein
MKTEKSVRFLISVFLKFFIFQINCIFILGIFTSYIFIKINKLKMKNYLPFFFIILFSVLSVNGYTQSYGVPEILYYKFNTGTTTTPNLAVPGQGFTDAQLLNMTMVSGGQFGNALLGNGGTGSTTCVNSGWNMNLGTSSWTISLWINGITSGTYYLFGNDITTSFRCFTNGAAGTNAITLRGNGITNVDVTGVLPGPSVVHFVYDASTSQITKYLNGVSQGSVSQTPLNLTATVPFKVGGYGTANSIPSGSLLDEFRFYNRALTAAEITATWNVELPVGGSLINPTKVCDYGLIPQYSGGSLGGHASATLGDTLYIVGGSTVTGTGTNPAASTMVTRYAVNSGVWSAGRNLPTDKVGGDLVKCGNNLYYLGGGNVTLTGAVDNLTYKYDPVSGWTAVANIPTPVMGPVAESWGDSVIFCMMGGWSNYFRGIQIYRPASNTWSRATDSLPSGAGRRTFAGGIQGNKLFVAAGYSGTFRKDFYIGTIGSVAESITWVQGPDVPVRGTGNSRPGGHAVNNRFYVVAGETTPGAIAQDSIYIWSVTDSTWLPQILVGRGANSASNYWGVISSSVVGNKIKIWIPGGFYPTTVTTTKLFCLTDSMGCVITGNSNNTSAVPSVYKLSQNYPNPFNPVTRIEYSVPVKSIVSLKLYDITGRLIKVLINDFKNPGNYSYEFNGSDLSSGVYFYKLDGLNYSDSKKMILVK